MCLEYGTRGYATTPLGLLTSCLALLGSQRLLFTLNLWFLMIEIIQIKYLNNIIEQDHRSVKKKMKAALGFKSTQGAKATISGVELYRMLKKKQMDGHQDKPAYEQFYLLAA
nr:DDE-type integrase/transposase/recombinase [Piscirickettsia salmonis]